MKKLLLVFLSIATVAFAGERAPGEWLNDNMPLYGSHGDIITVEEYMGMIVKNSSPPMIIPSESETVDIERLLTRCLEFLRDGDRDLYEAPVFAAYSPDTLKSIALDSIEEAQNALARLEKETQLRRDIERAISLLRGDHGTLPTTGE